MSKFMLSFLFALSLQSCASDESKKEISQTPVETRTLSEASFLDITPLADGGAYAHEFGGTIWYLKGGEAIKVKEVSQLSVQPSSISGGQRERALWTLLQYERAKRKSAESERDSYADNSSDDGYEERY